MKAELDVARIESLINFKGLSDPKSAMEASQAQEVNNEELIRMLDSMKLRHEKL